MRTLTGTLTAAQKKLEGLRPVIKLDVSDRPVEIPRWAWAVVSSEVVASCHGAACVARDGAVVRVRVKTDGSLQVARLASPATDNWATAWADVAAGPYSTLGQASIGALSDADRVVIAYVAGNGESVLYRVSSDNGATYGAEQTLASVPPASGMYFYGVSLYGTAGYIYAALALDLGTAEPNDTVYAYRWSIAAGWAGGGWQTGQNAVHSVGTLVEGEVQRIVTAGADGLLRWDRDWASGWTSTAVLGVAANGAAGFAVSVPRMFVSPDGSGRYYYTWLESWTAAVSGSRYWIAATPDKDVIGEGLIFDTNRGKGWDLFVIGSTWYFVSPVTHYTAGKYTGSATQRLDLGADVVAFDLEEAGENKATRGRVWLNNADGRYASPGSGTYAMLREGSRVCLGLGYKTSAGDEYAWLPPLWVEGWAHVDEEGAGWLVLELGDAWAYLDRCRVRSQVSYTGLTLAAIADKLCKRVSASTLGAVAGLSVVAGSFTLRPGDSVGGALRRVLNEAGARLRFDTTAVSGDPGAWNACVAETVAIGSGASGYSFGGSGHPVLRGEYAGAGQRVNVVEVYGSGFWDWDWDKPAILAAGHVFVEKEADWLLDSAGDVDDRATRLLDGAQRRATGGWLEVLPAVGAELYDVVDVTASRAGLSAAVRRVAGIRWRYDGRKRGMWVQRLELEGV